MSRINFYPVSPKAFLLSSLAKTINGATTFGSSDGIQIQKLTFDLTQDYIFTEQAANSALALQSQTSATANRVWLFTTDGDGTDNNEIRIFGVGTPSSIANRERLSLLWSQSNDQYEIFTDESGDGTLRPLVLYTSGNADQLKLNTDGSISFSGSITLADTLSIQTGVADDDYFMIKADDTGVGVVEVARAQGAADPYFSMGGSQEFKFTNAGLMGLYGVTPVAQAAHLTDPTNEAENSAAIVTIIDELKAYGLMAADP